MIPSKWYAWFILLGGAGIAIDSLVEGAIVGIFFGMLGVGIGGLMLNHLKKTEWTRK